MHGTPENDLDQLRTLVQELQAVIAVQDARHRALRCLVVDALAALKISFGEDGSAEECLRRLTDEELDARLAEISDDDPAHASVLKKIVESARRLR